ncbi:MAG: prepilin-type N-terminal cleavage/methylation domain-containing protein [Verrucomicrobiales bacterium]
MNHSTRTSGKVSAARGGFTLLEVILGITVASIVLYGIFKTAVGCLDLSNAVTERQQKEMHLHSMLGVLRRNIEDIPGNARISMEPPDETGGRSEIVLEDYPLAFSWAGVAAGSKRVLIISDRDARGGSQIRIRYLNAEEAQSHAEGNEIPEDDALGIVLMDGLKNIWWRFYNQRTADANQRGGDNGSTEEAWEEDWVRPNERPSLVEMNVEFHDGSESLRSVFWIPVVVNPETVVRGIQSGGNRSSGARPGGGRDGGRGDGRGDRRSDRPGVQLPPGFGGAGRSPGAARPSGGRGGRPSGGSSGGRGGPIPGGGRP